MNTNLKSWPITLLFCAAAVAGFVAGNKGIMPDAGASAFYLVKGSETMARWVGVSCNIKGNISATGERIFLVPGDRNYDEAVVSGIYGERYFCSEAEARRAGWQRFST